MNSLNKSKKELLREMLQPNIFAISNNFAMSTIFAIPSNMFYLLYPSMVSPLAAFGRSFKIIPLINFLDDSKKEMLQPNIFAMSNIFAIPSNIFYSIVLSIVSLLAAFGRSFKGIFLMNSFNNFSQ